MSSPWKARKPISSTSCRLAASYTICLITRSSKSAISATQTTTDNGLLTTDKLPMTTDKPSSENYSPGLEGIIAGETSISTVDTGLTYRGYAIEDLAEHSNYEEVAYLILYGELPTSAQATAFRQRLGAAAKVPSELIEALRRIPQATPSMDVLRSAVSLLAHWEPEVADGSHYANVHKTERLLAQIPVVVAARQRLKSGQEPIAADPALT